MAARYFEFKDDKSDKFWEVDLKGSDLHLRWGKTGSAGQSQVKNFESEEKAQKEYDKLIAEKTKKGYQEGKATETKGSVDKAPAKTENKPNNDKNAYDFKLLEAVKANDLNKVKEVLAGEFNINGTSENGSTILMWASKSGNAAIVKALLEAGADHSLAMASGSTALAIAAKGNHVEAVKILLAAGAKVDSKSIEVVLDRGYFEIFLEFNRANSKKSKVATEFQETFGFLCETSEDKTLLEALSYLVKNIKKTDTGGLEIKINDDVIECNPPFTGKPNIWVPKSYAAIATHFNGISWESIGGGDIGFGGLNDSGDPENDWGWDSSYLEEGGEERDDLADATPAFGCGQNWLLFDPVKKNKRGDAALAFVGHDGCTWELVESANDLLYGSVLLKLMAQYFLSVDFDGIYN